MKAGPNRHHGSAASELLCLHLRASRIDGWEPEYRFHPERKFRWDVAFPADLLAVEIQGGIWRRGGGAHTGLGAVRDCEKFSLGAILGWRVLVVSTDHVRSGEALRWIEAALGARTEMPIAAPMRPVARRKARPAGSPSPDATKRPAGRAGGNNTAELGTHADRTT